MELCVGVGDIKEVNVEHKEGHMGFQQEKEDQGKQLVEEDGRLLDRWRNSQIHHMEGKYVVQSLVVNKNLIEMPSIKMHIVSVHEHY